MSTDLAAASDTPPWTSARSTWLLGSMSRCRFCTEPSDSSTLRVTPLRARIFLYCSAVLTSALSFGPALIVMVLGGAGSASQTINPITTMKNSAKGADVNERSRQATCEWSCRERGRCGRCCFMRPQGNSLTLLGMTSSLGQDVLDRSNDCALEDTRAGANLT